MSKNVVVFTACLMLFYGVSSVWRLYPSMCPLKNYTSGTICFNNFLFFLTKQMFGGRSRGVLGEASQTSWRKTAKRFHNQRGWKGNRQAQSKHEEEATATRYWHRFLIFIFTANVSTITFHTTVILALYFHFMWLSIVSAGIFSIIIILSAGIFSIIITRNTVYEAA